MAGRFISSTNSYSNMLETISTSVKTILNNPYYLYNDKKASRATYYNINTTMTTLDEATRDNYAEIDPNSPIRYNKIIGMFLYGLGRLDPSLQIDDMGLESGDITGELIVLPNTIVPYPGDFFLLDQIEGPYLFKVTSVSPNTLDTGATMYQINYALSYTDGSVDIEPQVVKTYRMSIGNVGSNFASLIEEDTYGIASEIERYTVMLKDYFQSIFFDNRIQGFAYFKNDLIKVYDPYLVEFLIRNKILSGSTDYIHVCQQMYLSPTFGVWYDRTFFAALEEKSLDRHRIEFTGNLRFAGQTLSLLYAYPENYYYMEYERSNATNYIIDIFDDPEFLRKIESNYTESDSILKQLIIDYFNDTEVSLDKLKELKNIDYCDNKELYYLVPMVIFCLEQYLQSMLQDNSI